jgi:hypothetical protein
MYLHHKQEEPMLRYDIICPMCGGIFHETNENFRQNIPANGSMFRKKQEIIDAGWSTFPEYADTEYADIICPGCDGAYLDSTGHVLKMVESGEIPDLRKEAPGTEYAMVKQKVLTSRKSGRPRGKTTRGRKTNARV